MKLYFITIFLLLAYFEFVRSDQRNNSAIEKYRKRYDLLKKELNETFIDLGRFDPRTERLGVEATKNKFNSTLRDIKSQNISLNKQVISMPDECYLRSEREVNLTAKLISIDYNACMGKAEHIGKSRQEEDKLFKNKADTIKREKLDAHFKDCSRKVSSSEAEKCFKLHEGRAEKHIQVFKETYRQYFSGTKNYSQLSNECKSTQDSEIEDKKNKIKSNAESCLNREKKFYQ